MTPTTTKAAATCQSCRRRPATQRVRIANGTHQERCDICAARLNPSGFKKKVTA